MEPMGRNISDLITYPKHVTSFRVNIVTLLFIYNYDGCFNSLLRLTTKNIETQHHWLCWKQMITYHFADPVFLYFLPFM